MRYPIPADRFREISLSRADLTEGLGAAQVEERRRRHGANAIVAEPGSRWLEILGATTRDPMIWFLVATGVLYASIGQRREALILVAAIVPLIGMDAWLHRRSRISTRALRGRLASRVTAIRSGAPVSIPEIGRAHV